ncbi:hypothetical protein MBLNU230_g8184t1 [Neophaeotheca triangularis]
MDPLTFKAVVEMQLEDSQTLLASSKGKQREGTINDAEFALQMYAEDLRACDATLADRTLAQSIATAVIRDGAMIQRAYQAEEQLASDRELALRLSNTNDEALGVGRTAACPSGTFPKPKTQCDKSGDPWQDVEMLAKASAIYMGMPTTYKAPRLPSSSDSDTIVAESSAWAASRRQTSKAKLSRCVICQDEFEFYSVVRTPCDHEYCRECLAALFQHSMTDESLFPPRCCNKPVQIDWVSFFLPRELVKDFKSKEPELATSNRTYCHDKRCSTFIPNSTIRGDVATCPTCSKTTCAMCKNPSHTGDCPEDTALQELLSTANDQQWQRCYKCHRIVELAHGCNHITCTCGAQFCYVCGAEWHTCNCEQWDERRLVARATQVVDRDPGRRLFQPQRTYHEQPTTPARSRRPSGPLQQLQYQSLAATMGLDPDDPTPRNTGYHSESSIYEDDFSDHSMWEEDFQSEDEIAPSPGPAAATEPGLEPNTATKAVPSRDQLIAAAVEYLRANHQCSHDKWRWVRGGHQCEECSSWLKQYIFECRQCRLQACNRCRRNRL